MLFFLVVVPNHESHVDKSEISNIKKNDGS